MNIENKTPAADQIAYELILHEVISIEAFTAVLRALNDASPMYELSVYQDENNRKRWLLLKDKIKVVR